MLSEVPIAIPKLFVSFYLPVLTLFCVFALLRSPPPTQQAQAPSPQPRLACVHLTVSDVGVRLRGDCSRVGHEQQEHLRITTEDRFWQLPADGVGAVLDLVRQSAPEDQRGLQLKVQAVSKSDQGRALRLASALAMLPAIECTTPLWCVERPERERVEFVRLLDADGEVLVEWGEGWTGMIP